MKKKLIYTLSALIFIGIAGCKKLEDFGETNDNPAATTKANSAALLTNSLQTLASMATERTQGWYAQYFSETQYSSLSLYAANAPAFTGTYSGPLYDLQNIQLENTSNNMNQVAKIVQQYIFWNLTDRFGDIPYSQSLKGLEFPTPKYDTQEEIYKGILTTLTTSVAAMDGSVIAGDIVYGNNAASWKRFANSLRMLVSLQLSKRYPSATGYAATEFKAALSDANGYITTNDQNCKLVFTKDYQNEIWKWYNGRKDDAESKTMTDLLTSLGDSRINPFGGSSEVVGANGTSSIGVPYGVVRATAEAFTAANPTWARVLRGDLRTDVSPVYVITAGQVALARAEAANLGWTTEVLATVYAQGIALSHQQWGLSAPDATYLANASVAVGAVGAANNIRNISVQRYIASYPDGHQGWNIWRKTGFPTLTPAPDAVNSSKQIPRRYMYSTTEYSNNGVNVREAVARLAGGDTMDARIWWDQN